MTDLSTPRSRGFNLFERLSQLQQSMAERRERGRKYREVYTELASLSDRELADINVPRGMIREIAADAAGLSRA